MYRKDKPQVLQVRRFINLHRGVIYGMMLGDATIEGRGSDARLRVRHAVSQKEYVLHKHGIFSELATAEAKGSLWGNGHEVWGFDTSTSSEWQRVWSVFHQDMRVEIRQIGGREIRYCRKTVTQKILDGLDYQGIAFWFMDDGCLDVSYNKKWDFQGKRFVLSTDGFTLPENELILKWFHDEHGLTARLSKNHYKLKDGSMRQSWRLRFAWTEYQKLIPKIERYFIPSMRYKIEPSQDNGRLAHGETKTRSELHGNVQSQPEMADRPQLAGQ